MTTTTQNQLTLIYIDIFPLLFNNQTLKIDLIRSLKEIMSDYSQFFLESIPTTYPWFTNSSLLFTALHAKGTININLDSISPVNLSINQTINNEGYHKVYIKCTEATIQNGYGFFQLLLYRMSMTLQGEKK